MKELSIQTITNEISGKLVSGNPSQGIHGVVTDSRIAKNGDVFFALKGERTDGHKYLKQVFEAGCSAAIVSDISSVPEELLSKNAAICIVEVEDTFRALQKLAQYYLTLLPIKKKIAVTGSVGKTSTRDMMYYAAKTKYPTARSIKNYNNGIGLPLSIFEFPEDTEVAVLEMGMDDFGEIELLADLVRPDIGIITNIGISHIEKLGSREGILQAKMEVTSFFDENSVLIVNTDCDLLTPERTGGNYQLITVGSNPGNDFLVSNVMDFGDQGIKYTLECETKTYEIQLPVPGAHNSFNASLVLAAAQLLGISPEVAVEGLKHAELTEKRLKIRENNQIKVIDDTYNACPASMKSAINTLTSTKGERKICVLGDMYELGSESKAAHEDVGAYAGEKRVDFLFAIGKDARYYAEGAKNYLQETQIIYVEEKKDCISTLKQLIRPGDIILVKGSRGMGMEEIVEEIHQEKE